MKQTVTVAADWPSLLAPGGHRAVFNEHVFIYIYINIVHILIQEVFCILQIIFKL